MNADELRKLHEEATVAPWKTPYSEDDVNAWVGSPGNRRVFFVAGPSGQSDAALIVALRNAYADGTLIHADEGHCAHVWLSQLNELRCGDSGMCPFGGDPLACNAAFDLAHEEDDHE